MADTISWVKDTVEGDLRVKYGVLTAGGGAIGTGLNWVIDCQATPMTSMNSAGNKSILINTAASGAGDVEMASATAGDDFRIRVAGW